MERCNRDAFSGYGQKPLSGANGEKGETTMKRGQFTFYRSFYPAQEGDSMDRDYERMKKYLEEPRFQ